MRTTALAILTLAGLGIVATAALHGFVGGGSLLAELESGGISADLRAGMAIGWTMGSLCWATLGWIVLLAAHRLRRGDAGLRLPSLGIGVVFLGFGLWALAVRGLKPHFLVFIALGLLVIGALAILRERAA